VLTVIERPADGSVAIAMFSGPPPLSAVSAYGPPGTLSVAGPPPVLTDTESGGSAKVSRAGPPPVSTATRTPAWTITVKLTLQAAADDRGTMVDVTTGNNSSSFIQNNALQTVVGYHAGPGYDLASGVGTVNVGRFVPELVQASGLG
jgi:hypothetical protein